MENARTLESETWYSYETDCNERQAARRDAREEAKEFANEVGPERLVSVSESRGGDVHYEVTVWYWSEAEDDQM